MADFRPVMPIRVGNIVLMMKAPTLEEADALKQPTEGETAAAYYERLRTWACSEGALIDYTIDGQHPAVEGWRAQVRDYILAHPDDVAAVVSEVAFRPRTSLARAIEERSIGLAP